VTDQLKLKIRANGGADTRHQIHLAQAERAGDSDEFDNIDLALATLDVRDDGVWAADPTGELPLGQARGFAGFNQHANRRSIGWRGNPSPHDARLWIVRRLC